MLPAARVVSDLVSSIAPVDETERAHLAEAARWVHATGDLFRRRKPDVPPRHLVSYIAVVDPGRTAVYLVDHRAAGLWLPPGGHVEPGEHPVRTACREIEEELGITVDLTAMSEPLFLTITTTVGSDGGHEDVSLWYVVTVERDTVFTLDPTEFRDGRWWSIDEIGAADPALFDPHLGRFLAKLRGDTRSMHAWRIEEREYARQETRRGRRFAYPDLDPLRTALVVIDMVPMHVSESAYCRGIVPGINRLAGALRAAGGTVAWVVPEPGEPTPHAVEFFGPRVARIFSGSGVTETPEQRIWPELEIREHDLFVEKSAYSAFFPGRCPLPELLGERGIDTVLITGTVTDVCCSASARDASTRGFRVIMVADANAARRDRDHNATLHTIYRSFGDVRPVAEVVRMIEAGPGLPETGAGGRPVPGTRGVTPPVEHRPHQV